ncbi:hypothetical protein BGZ98_003562 [Dissophora globulifera]|nr:hypothetical protein BGZ98_003562 [Dissophora globulifera]
MLSPVLPLSPTESKPSSLQILRQQQQRQLELQRQQQLEQQRQEQERQEQERQEQERQEQERQLQLQQPQQTLPDQTTGVPGQGAPSTQDLPHQQHQTQHQQEYPIHPFQSDASNATTQSQAPQQGYQSSGITGDGLISMMNQLVSSLTAEGRIPDSQQQQQQRPRGGVDEPIGGIKTEEGLMPPPPTLTTGGAGRGEADITYKPLTGPVAITPSLSPSSSLSGPAGGGAGANAVGAGSGASPQIFKATYSGVPVFEMICKGVAVMRRRSDSYLNATQILKVAEFDKPQRTRILEREVQKGEHEKVQGGYGKYQGTWVPFRRGVQLCQEYNVLHLLQPLIDYLPTQTSPPLAPKHITAASNRPRKPREPRPLGTLSPSYLGKPRIKPLRRKMKQKGGAQLLPRPGMGPTMGVVDGATGDESGTMPGTEDGEEDLDDDATSDDEGADTDVSMDETMSILSDQSRIHTRTPSPVGSGAGLSSEELSDRETSFSSASTSTSPAGRRRHPTSQDRSPSSLRKRQGRPGDELFLGYEGRRGTRKRRINLKAGRDQDVEMDSGSHLEEEDEMDIDDNDQDTAFQRDSSPSLRSKANRRSVSRTRASDQDDRKSTPSSTITTSAVTGVQSLETASRGPYADTLLEFFISDAVTLPKVLTDPPADMDFNIVIDDEGHTALHWAAAMAKLDVVKVLVQNGADTYRVNTDGQTALMRSVLFSNNFDQKTFAALLELLQKTIFTIDKDDQTVFHHVVNTAGQRGKIHTARYYLECLLDKLAQHPSELASIINVQDHVGDTALTIAARLQVGGKKVAKMLIDAGADLNICNRTGKNAKDYLLETEQAVASSASSLPPATTTSGVGNSRHSAGKPPAVGTEFGGNERHSNSSNKIGNRTSRQQHSQPSRYPSEIVDPRRQKLDQGLGLGAYPGAHPPPPSSSLLPPFAAHGSSGSPSKLYSQLQKANSWANASTSRSNNTARLPGGGGPPISSSLTVIPTVSDLFTRLTQSYEKDIFEKDQDIQEARSLLQGIQKEIAEGHRTIYELKAKTATMGQAEEQIRTLEGLIKQEIQVRQRLRLQELIAEEEERLRSDATTNKEADKGVNGDVAVAVAGEEANASRTEGQSSDETKRPHEIAEAKGDTDVTMTAASGIEGVVPGIVPTDLREKDQAPSAPDQTAITAAVAAAVTDAVSSEQQASSNSKDVNTVTGSTTASPALETEVEQLRTRLQELQQQRKNRVDEIVQLKSQQGKRQHEYHRLIALCCNVAIDQVDELLDPLLTSLGDGEGAEEVLIQS